MKTKSRRRWLVAAGLLLSMSSMTVSAVSLNLEPAATIAGPGAEVSLDLVIEGLGDFVPESLGDFDVDIRFDPGALSFLGYTLGPYLGDLGLFEAIDYGLGDLGGGLVNLTEVSLLEPDAPSCSFCILPYLDEIQPNTFALATLDFRVVALPPGTSTVVSVETVYALDDGFGIALPLDSTTDAVIRNPALGSVPEPAMGVGMIGIGFRRRKRLMA